VEPEKVETQGGKKVEGVERGEGSGESGNGGSKREGGGSE